MRDAIYDRLTGDATLMATLTGGLHTETEITRQLTPTAFDDNDEIKPSGLLKMEASTPTGPYDHSQRQYFAVYLYQRSGYDSIDTAKDRVYTLLHRQRVTPATGSCWQIRHVGDTPDLRDEALGCNLAICRYMAVYARA